jgi:peptidoglycan/xylan/chitin deacetylase (PgdA/CDA1 family)
MLLPYYHIVSDEWVPHVSPLYRFRTSDEFSRDLDWFLTRNHSLGLNDFLSATTKGTSTSPNSFFLTFDDGFREVFDVIRPILLAKGVPAVFFVMSGSVDNKNLCFHQKMALILDALSRESAEFTKKVKLLLLSLGIQCDDVVDAIRSMSYSQSKLVDEVAVSCGIDFAGYLTSKKPYLTTEQIAILLADGFGVGAHSIDHPLYSKIGFDEQIRQTRESMQFLVDRFALKYRVFAFPHSDSNVSAAFFENVHSNDAIQVTFGTSAPHVDCMDRSFQRFSMERSKRSAASVVAVQMIRRLKQRLTGQSLIKRD